MDVSDNLGALISSLDTRLSATESVVAARPTAQDIADAAAAKTAAAGTKVKAIGAEAEQETRRRRRSRWHLAPNDEANKKYGLDHLTPSLRHGDQDHRHRECGDDDPKFIDQDAGLDGGRTMHVRTMEAN